MLLPQVYTVPSDLNAIKAPALPLVATTLVKAGFPGWSVVTWYQVVLLPVAPFPLTFAFCDNTQTSPEHVVIAIVWYVTNIILTSPGTIPVGKPLGLPFMATFWKTVPVVIVALITVPSVDHAYKPSVANTIPCGVLTKSLATYIFKGVAVPKAGKFVELRITGEKRFVTPSFPISSPHTRIVPSFVLATVLWNDETKLSYSIVAALVFELKP